VRERGLRSIGLRPREARVPGTDVRPAFFLKGTLVGRRCSLNKGHNWSNSLTIFSEGSDVRELPRIVAYFFAVDTVVNVMATRPNPPKTTPAIEARRIRMAALPRAAQVVVELLEHSSGGIRLQAAQELADRVEGKPRQTVQVDGPSEDELLHKAAVSALFRHVKASTPALFGAAVEWGDAVENGRPATFPAGLTPPTDSDARELWDGWLAASVTVKVLP
jgi:hypothetical protein